MKSFHAARNTMTAIALYATTALGGYPESPVGLGAAADFVILAKSGISTVPGSSVTGDMGVSPIDSTAITGFALILDGLGTFSTSVQVAGKIYAADYAAPTPVILTTAVSDMEAAYTDGAGRTLPDHTELGAGTIGGMTLAPGLYKWGTSVLIDTDVTLAGGPDDVWIFQIAGNLTVAEATSVLLSGGAQAMNIFWQVAGGVGVEIGTTAHMEGNILSQAGINLRTNSSINGRLLAQTAVTLQSNTVTAPARASAGSIELRSAAVVAGAYTHTQGQYVSIANKSIAAPLAGSVQFYCLSSDTAVAITRLYIRHGVVLIAYQ